MSGADGDDWESVFGNEARVPNGTIRTCVENLLQYIALMVLAVLSMEEIILIN